MYILKTTPTFCPGIFRKCEYHDVLLALTQVRITSAFYIFRLKLYYYHLYHALYSQIECQYCTKSLVAHIVSGMGKYDCDLMELLSVMICDTGLTFQTELLTSYAC